MQCLKIVNAQKKTKDKIVEEKERERESEGGGELKGCVTNGCLIY